jgi:hypothetical protein
MGDPLSGSTDEWVKTLFPSGTIETSGTRKRVQVGSERIYLLEVTYEDFNDAVLEKFDAMTRLVANASEGVRDALKEYAGDVVTQVLVKNALDGAIRRFLDAYSEAIRIAIREKPPGTDTREANLGVLSHSLGTLIAYEGLFAAGRSPFLTTVLEANLVMCAPMLSPISAVQSFIGQNRYLTRFGCRKPRNPATIRQCLALYDESDPFFQIQGAHYYDYSDRNNLVDNFVLFDSDPGVKFWDAHSMIDSYLANNNNRIAGALLA